MRRFLLNTTSVILATMLLTATSGVNLFIHHCECRGDVLLSVFQQTGCGSTHLVTHTCCSDDFTQKVKEKSSCGCWNESINIKLENFAPIQETDTKNSLQNFTPQIDNWDIVIKNDGEKLITSQHITSSPPYISNGRIICIKNHQLKISGTLQG